MRAVRCGDSWARHTSTPRMSTESVEDKAARALAAAHAFLARSPVPKRAHAASAKANDGDEVGGDVGGKLLNLSRSDSSASTSASTRAAVRADDVARESVVIARRDAPVVSRSASAVSSTKSSGATNVVDDVERRSDDEDDEGGVMSPVRDVDDVVNVFGDDEGYPEPSFGDPPGVRRVKVMDTPKSVKLELSSESDRDEDEDDGEEVVESPGPVEEHTYKLDSTVRVLDVQEMSSESEGVFARAIERERVEKSMEATSARSGGGAMTASDAVDVDALSAQVKTLSLELESMRWEREALEARTLEAEKIAAEAQAKTVSQALSPENQLTNEQVAALKAEIEQVDYLKRLLARAEQMRNTARLETKQARDKHEKDLETLRAELTTMDEEMENLRRRVKNDRVKIEAMEKATIEAADEFRALYHRQELTRRLLGATFIVIFALIVQFGLAGNLGMMKNMYQY